MGGSVLFPTQPSPRPAPERPLRKWLFAGGGILALLLVWTCGRGAYSSYRVADSAVGHFHALLNQSEYEELYGDATDEFRRMGERSEQIAFLEKVHTRMGNAGKTKLAGFHNNATNKGTFVNLVYQTDFEQGQAREGFVWRVSGEQARLIGYHIDSPNLR